MARILNAMINDEYHELLDLVNDRDEVIGTILRGQMVKANYRMDGKHVRFVNGFVVNTKGLVWVQTRSHKKSIAPGGLDFSVAEHVLSGETYEQAIVRGFHEELGWQIGSSQLTHLGVLPPAADRPVFDSVFALLNYSGDDPVLNTDEFVSGEWLNIDEIRRQFASRTAPQKSSLLPAIELLEKILD